MDTTEPTPAKRQAPWRKWAARGALALSLVLAGVLAAGVFLLSSLDAPWLKARLQREVQEAAGLEVDWSRGALSPGSGLQLEDLRVRSPAALRGTAPDFVHASRVAVAWSPGRLLRNERPLLDAVTIEGLEVTVVDDLQRGRTLDLLFPATPPPAVTPPPGPGLSSTLQGLFAGGPFVRSLKVPGVALNWKKVDHDAVIDQASLQGLGLSLEGWHAQLGSLEAPLALEAQGHHAVLRLLLDAEGSGAGATLHAQGSLERQDFEPALELHQLLELEAKAAFEPRAHRLLATVSALTLLDGAATGTAQLERADDGALLVQVAAFQLALVPLLVDAAALGVPVSAAAGTLALGVHELRVLPELAFLPKGALTAHARLGAVEYRQPEAAARLAQAALEVALGAGEDGAQELDFTARLGGLAQGAATVEALRLDGSATQGRAGWHGQAKLGANGASAAGARLGSAELELRAADVVLAQRFSGKATLTGSARKLGYDSPSLKVGLEQLGLTLEGATDGQPPYAARVSLEGPLHLGDGAGSALFDGPLELRATATQLLPAAQTGLLEADVTLADSALHLEAKKLSDGAHLEAKLVAKSLALLERLVALPAGWKVPWSRASATLETTIDAEALGSKLPRFTHVSSAELRGLEAQLPKGALAVPSLKLTLAGHGSTEVHAGTLGLTCARCVLGPAALGDERLTAAFELDRLAPKLRAQLDAGGPLGPDVHGLVTLGYLKAEHRTRLDANLTVSRLGSLAPLVEGTPASRVDLTRLGLSVRATGTAPGRGLDLETATGSIDATLTHLLWEDGERSVEVPSLWLEAQLERSAEGQQLSATLRGDSLELALGENTATLLNLAVGLEAQLASASPKATGALGMTVGEVKQDFAPAYPVRGLRISAAGARDEQGLLTLSRSTLVNEAAGTALWLEGALALDPRRSKATAQAELTQDLSLAWRDPKVFEGKGTAVLRLGVHSADLREFHTSGSLLLDGVDAQLPAGAAEAVQGELPFAMDFVSDAKGVHPLRTAHVNPYALLRFQDQHPMLKSQSFLTVQKLTTPQVTLGPLAANVQLVEGVLYLSQLELGLSGGQVTGEMAVDMNEKDPRVRANVRATGVKSQGGDVFSGNAALAISLRDHSIDGRAEVLQISRRQLLTLLDLSDPHHVSASTNRLRSVLTFGYPERVHILFNHGFATAKVTFGGAAGLVKLDELRGIPVESLMDRYLTDETPEGT
jgi:hypothetical protein